MKVYILSSNLDYGESDVIGVYLNEQDCIDAEKKADKTIGCHDSPLVDSYSYDEHEVIN